MEAAAEALTASLSAVEEDIYQVRNQSGQDPLNFPIKTNNRLASLLRVALTGEGRPTGNVEPIFNELVAELKAEQDRLDKTLATDLVDSEPHADADQEGADQRQVAGRSDRVHQGTSTLRHVSGQRHVVVVHRAANHVAEQPPRITESTELAPELGAIAAPKR